MMLESHAVNRTAFIPAWGWLIMSAGVPLASFWEVNTGRNLASASWYIC